MLCPGRTPWTCDHARVLRQHAPRIAAIAGAALLVGVLVVIAKAWYDSRLPGTYSVMDYGHADYGGGSVLAHAGHGGSELGLSVAALHGPRNEVPDRRFTLTAKTASVRLASGRVVDAMTFDGIAPGPELRVKQGDLVEVTVSNEDIDQGVTIHWHGVDVPNAEDGVAGVTQDAILPGERHTYRFRAEQVGTFWYHSHQVSSSEVRRGLFGAFVIEPSELPAHGLDMTIAAHTFDGIPTLNANDALQRRAVRPGTPVRLRLINTDSVEQRFTLTGTPFRVVAIDGSDLSGATPLQNTTLVVGGGGRMDIGFTMPAGPVQLSLDKTSAAVAFSPDGEATPPANVPGPEFDPLDRKSVV